jgi:phosphate acyltransferase
MGRLGRVSHVRIAIDAFGTDARPKPDVEGSWLAAREFPEDEFVLVGDLAVVEAELSQYDVLANLRVVHAPYDVKMTASAVDALKEGDESSLHIGLRLVESGSADAFVTMGNTGATHSIAMLKTLGRIHGIKRPAISALYPINGRVVAFLDIGANTDCKPDWLVQFGELGSIYMKTALQMEAPKVALMSIGEEQAKGNAAVQAAYDLLSTSSLDFVGNIEPKDLLTSEVNVVIMDGFVGNLFLKTFESAMSYVTNVIRSEIRAGLVSSVGGLLIAPAIGRVRARLDPLEIGGAPLLGVDGIVIIGHGRSNARTVRNAVQQARQAVSGGTLQRLRAYFNGKEHHGTHP